jgi:hypothetical protein
MIDTRAEKQAPVKPSRGAWAQRMLVDGFLHIQSAEGIPLQSLFPIRTPGTSMPPLEAAVMRSIS